MFLISTVETYRCENESEAVRLIDDAKNDSNFILNKYTNELKEVKAKGEVVDSYYKTTLTKTFTDIKEPEVAYKVSYEVAGA